MLLLASNSLRRRQLLGLCGWTFKVMPVEIDERPLRGEKPREYVLRLAEDKARATASQVQGDVLVLAADTSVVDKDDAGEKIIGKPSDAMEAEATLRLLQGRTHKVYTALALLRVDDGTTLTDWCATDVPMREYTDEEIRTYVASGDPFDKAGAYAIQHTGFRPVKNLQGCYANVMGLPLCHLTRTLERLDVEPGADVPMVCQSTLQYHCPIFRQVLGR